MERVLGNKVNFSNLVIHSLLTSCQFINEPNREISRGVFQNRGVCGQAFPLLLSPSPPPPSIFLLPLQLSRYNATGNACYAGYCGLYFITRARRTLKRKSRVCEQAKNSCQYEIGNRSVSWKRDFQVTSQRKRSFKISTSTALHVLNLL